MNIDYTKLEKLGFSRNQALVYLALADSGTTGAGELIKKTGFHRNIVYDNLEKLVNQGLVSFIIRGGKRHYHLARPEMLIEVLERDQKRIEYKKSIAKELIPMINRKLESVSAKKEATVYRGVNGVKWVLMDTLEEGKDYVSFGAPASSLDLMPKNYWRNYNSKVVRKKIHMRLLFNESLKDWARKISNNYTHVRLLRNEINPLTETIVYGDKVAIIVWTSVPTTVLIKDIEAANSYREWFEILWNSGKDLQ